MQQNDLAHPARGILRGVNRATEPIAIKKRAAATSTLGLLANLYNTSQKSTKISAVLSGSQPVKLAEIRFCSLSQEFFVKRTSSHPHQ